jgi:hypothetical protein
MDKEEEVEMNEYQKEVLKKNPIRFLLFVLGIGRRRFKKSKHPMCSKEWWDDQGFKRMELK